MPDEVTVKGRAVLKSGFGTAETPVSDQQQGAPCPPVEKPLPRDHNVITLPPATDVTLRQSSILKCMKYRRSRRKFAAKALTIQEFSFLLWATQGIDKANPGGEVTFRPVPSAGARHPFETYLAVNNVEGLTPGLYRYRPLEHELVLLQENSELALPLTEACLGQRFVGNAPVVFAWACIPYRTEWRYTTNAHKAMLLDAGHVCQNLYLAAEALGAGTCAIGAYDQQKVDALFQVDGFDELIVYLAPVGKMR